MSNDFCHKIDEKMLVEEYVAGYVSDGHRQREVGFKVVYEGIAEFQVGQEIPRARKLVIVESPERRDDVGEVQVFDVIHGGVDHDIADPVSRAAEEIALRRPSTRCPGRKTSGQRKQAFYMPGFVKNFVY